QDVGKTCIYNIKFYILLFSIILRKVSVVLNPHFPHTLLFAPSFTTFVTITLSVSFNPSLHPPISPSIHPALVCACLSFQGHGHWTRASYTLDRLTVPHRL
ncbi:hypothetical protein XENOCAPTIV_024497, partial [Xenoophorus captivus]